MSVPEAAHWETSDKERSCVDAKHKSSIQPLVARVSTGRIGISPSAGDPNRAGR
jgi:hypothetical protein